MSFYRWKEVPEEKVNSKLSRRLIVGETEMLALIHLKKGCLVPMHKHVNEQMSYVLKGALKFILDGKDVIVRKGEVLHIRPNLEHSALALEDTLDLDFFTPLREDWLSGKDYYLRETSAAEK